MAKVAFNSEFLSDVVLDVTSTSNEEGGNKKYNAHSTILALQSDPLASMFSGTFGPKGVTTFKIETKAKLKNFEKFCELLYTPGGSTTNEIIESSKGTTLNLVDELEILEMLDEYLCYPKFKKRIKKHLFGLHNSKTKGSILATQEGFLFLSNVFKIHCSTLGVKEFLKHAVIELIKKTDLAILFQNFSHYSEEFVKFIVRYVTKVVKISTQYLIVRLYCRAFVKDAMHADFSEYVELIPHMDIGTLPTSFIKEYLWRPDDASQLSLHPLYVRLLSNVVSKMLDQRSSIDPEDKIWKRDFVSAGNVNSTNLIANVMTNASGQKVLSLRYKEYGKLNRFREPEIVNMILVNDEIGLNFHIHDLAITKQIDAYEFGVDVKLSDLNGEISLTSKTLIRVSVYQGSPFELAQVILSVNPNKEKKRKHEENENNLDETTEKKRKPDEVGSDSSNPNEWDITNDADSDGGEWDYDCSIQLDEETGIITNKEGQQMRSLLNSIDTGYY